MSESVASYLRIGGKITVETLQQLADVEEKYGLKHDMNLCIEWHGDDGEEFEGLREWLTLKGVAWLYSYTYNSEGFFEDESTTIWWTPGMKEPACEVVLERCRVKPLVDTLLSIIKDGRVKALNKSSLVLIQELKKVSPKEFHNKLAEIAHEIVGEDADIPPFEITQKDLS